jgi:hypothetical protein
LIIHNEVVGTILNLLTLVMAAALFYQYLSEKDNEFLENNNYTKEEVLSGFKQLLIQSGYKELFYLIKDDK